MNIGLSLIILISFSAHASPVFSMKERLRLHMWAHGLEDKQAVKVVQTQKGRRLPEEIERALRKI